MHKYKRSIYFLIEENQICKFKFHITELNGGIKDTIKEIWIFFIKISNINILI